MQTYKMALQRARDEKHPVTVYLESDSWMGVPIHVDDHGCILLQEKGERPAHHLSLSYRDVRGVLEYCL